MSFNVFLTYSMEPDDQPLVWRLQTLATAQNINMYVPAHDLSRHNGALRPEVRAAIDRADCVLAIITARAGAAVQAELDYALRSNRLLVPIVRENIANGDYFDHFPKVFWFSPIDPPGTIEAEVVEFLKTQKLDKERKQALGAVVAIGVGMLVLAALSNRD